MNILFIGDISGRPGRRTIREALPEIRKNNGVDFVIANCENAAGGRGITKEKLDELISYGIDYCTAGEHVWDLKDFVEDLQNKSLPIVRPYNYEQSNLLPGKGYDEIDLGKAGKLVIISMIGQVFMRDNVRNPLWIIDELLEEKSKDWKDAIIIVDFHAEATAEKVTFGYYLKNRVTAVVGTHTHIGTVDTRLFGDTGYVTDAGMAGPYDASLWVSFEDTINNMKYPIRKPFNVEKKGRRVLNSVLIEVGDKSTREGARKCANIKRIDKIFE